MKATNNALTNAHVRPLANAADPRGFADRRRNFAQNAAFRSFAGPDWWRHGWHPYRHLGWIGPLFWPYAYGDFFYYALWPDDYQYVDPFWAYGYGDIYEAIFSPYSYDQYVAGPQAPARMATLAQGMAQSCDEEAAEVTGWPIDQIQSAVQPNPQQTALLDDLGNAIVEASHQIKIHCPTSVAFTPTTRLDQMHQRLQALVDAVNIISPPLTKFYDSLSDEQKARFNAIAPPAPKNATNGNAGTPSVQAQCNANVMAWPTDQIDNTVHPNDAQRAKLDALKSALSQGADTIKAACPTEVPPTPPDRLAAIGNRLKAMLQAVGPCSPHWRISTIRSATIRKRASTPWASSCSRRIKNRSSSRIALCAIRTFSPEISALLSGYGAGHRRRVSDISAGRRLAGRLVVIRRSRPSRTLLPAVLPGLLPSAN